MSGIRLRRASVFAFAALFFMTLVGPASGELVADNSGTMVSHASNTVSSIYPPVNAAVTLQDAFSSAPVTIESPSGIEFAPVQAPAFGAPQTVVAGPMQEWSAAMEEEPDSPGEGEEFAPLPEPSTWYAGLLTLAALLWPLGRRAWTLQRTPLNL